jgi:hypothetical protein
MPRHVPARPVPKKFHGMPDIYEGMLPVSTDYVEWTLEHGYNKQPRGPGL